VHWLDLVIVAAIAWVTFSAFSRGLIREVVTLAAFVVGAIVAGMLYDDLSANLAFLIDDETTRNLIAFGALFLGVVVLGQIVGGALKRTAALLMLGPFDHLGGAAFGFVKGVVLVEVALIAVSVFPISSEVAAAVDESTLAPVFLERAPVVEVALPPEFENALDTLRQWQVNAAAVGDLELGDAVAGDAAASAE
jgi:membrane protein required for colicin V production